MCRVRALLFTLLWMPLCALGQGYVYQTGNPTFSTQIPIEHGFINVNNGDVHLEFPISNPPQAGGILSSNARLVYDSRIWKIVDNSGNYSWQPTNSGSMGGWTILTGGETGKGITYATDGYVTTNTGCPNNSGGYSFGQNTQMTWDNFVWTDPVGTSHTFNADFIDNTTTCPIAPPSKSITFGGWAADSSGLYIAITGSTGTGLGPQSYTIKDKNGTQVYPSIRDRNGNTLGLDSNGNTIDTMGRTPVIITHNGNQIYLDVLTTAGSTARARYTITTEQVSYSTKFSQSGVDEASGSFTAIQSIQLPDGSQYQFGYDIPDGKFHIFGTSGELTSMTLPTGGVVNYGYRVFNDSFQNSNEWIASHVADGGTTTFNPRTLSLCSSSNGCQESVTMTSPDKNDTVYVFNLDKKQITNGSSWQSNVTAYQGQASGNVRLKAESTNYTYVTSPVGDSYVGQQATVVTTADTLSDVGVATQTATTLDPNFGSPVETKVWNYQTPFSNAPDVDTTYTYQGTFLQQTLAQDGSNNQLAKTTNDLDGVGNVTGQHQWINTTGQTWDTATTYSTYGFPINSTTPDGKTTYGYSSSDVLPTSITPATPSSGAVLTTAATHDISTGAVTSATDPNGQVTSYKNFDVFNRPQEVDNPDGGITQIAYTPTSASISAANSATGWTIQGYDTYGRLIRNSAATGISSNPWYMQDTCYNATGQVSFHSYRFQGQISQAPVCSGAGDSYLYDALGRTTQVTHGDGTRVVYSYKGRATQVTDENGVSTITQTDAFGRVTTACELSSDTTMPASGSPAACGTDIPGTGFVTSYSYNPAAFQTTATQGAQTRIFQTDSIGRTILTQEPESGQTTWSYAYNKTGLLVTRQKPKANQLVASVMTTTQTQYDALGRPISVTYDDGLTGNKLFSYDTPIAGATNVLGRLAEQYAAASDGPAIEIFGYDAMGRTNQVVTCLPSTCGNAAATQNYTYDYAGNMLSATDGVGATTNYSYTPASELTSITSPQSAGYPVTLVSNVVNGPNGPQSYQLGNGLSQVYGYDGMGRRTGGWLCAGSSGAGCPGGTQLYGATIGVSGGRINQACDTVLGTCGTMGYDSFNRLTARTATSGNAQNGSWTYDRYGNRWNQTVSPGGYQQQISFNTANNQAAGFQYDAAGNLQNDTTHSYTYDAEGNMVAVDGGSTAKYGYDASNHRVRFDIWNGAFEELYNLTGQKVVIWNAGSGSVVEEDTHLGTQPLAVYLSGSLFFEHQDWLGTERMLTDGAGNTAGSYLSLPFGDGFTDQGTDLDPYHFAGMDHDYESGLDHAQFREYSSAGGRWLSPDPYSGSYDWGNPQSLNRYAYVGNNPLSFTDPSGQDEVSGPGGVSIAGACGAALSSGGSLVPADVACGLRLFNLLGLFNHPSFHGSLKPRPNAQPWDEYNIHYGPNIAGALGLPDQTCEFGACGNSFAGPGLEDHHIFPQAFREWFEEHGIEIEAYTTALERAVHRLKPNGIHTRAGGNWNAAWKQWIEEHPNATTDQILNQGKKMLLNFGIGAVDILPDFVIIVDPCVSDPGMPSCQSGF